MLDPSSPVPLYHQLAEHLRREIAAGRLSEGEKIASEPELAALHGIGRPTVRQATESLVRDGLLERRRGSGTFVANSRRVDLFSPWGTLRAFDAAGIAVSTAIVCPVSPIVHAIWGEGLGLVRVIRSADAPVLAESFWFDANVFADLAKHPLQGRSLAQLVAEVYRLRPSYVHQSFRSQVARAIDTEHLQVALGHPLLGVERQLEFPSVGRAIRVDIVARTDALVFQQSFATSGTPAELGDGLALEWQVAAKD